ncbi:MAG: cob(I)yrinic acid a,c-diamide adenosyltransferase [Bacillota bacterium]|jgi:cob(I)alamin adenosyltransferase
MNDQQGLVMIYTGDGKGKTTAAMGLILRALGHDQRVLLVQFMKGQPTGEVAALRRFLPQVEIWRSGREEFVNADNPDEQDVRLASETMQRVMNAVVAGEYDLVVLDELNVAVDYGLVREELVLQLLSEKPASVTLVLTGRGASEAVMRVANLVSEVREVKHHWRQGIPAQPGIEF